MTVSSTVRRAGPFLGNGTQTVFPFEFKVLNPDDLLVVAATGTSPSNTDETELEINTDYSVVLNPNQETDPGGSITLVNPLESGHKLSIISDRPYVQEVALTNLGGFFPQVINTGLDNTVIQTQQLAELAERAIKVPVTDGRSADEYWKDSMDFIEDAKEITGENAERSEVAADRAEAAQQDIHNNWQGKLDAAADAADAAEDSAAQAKISEDLAEAAASAALLGSGNTFPDEPTGRAAVGDGEAFKVQGSGDIAAYEYRRIDASTSVLIAIYPSYQYVQQLDPLIPLIPEISAYAPTTFNDNKGRSVLAQVNESLYIAGNRLTASYAGALSYQDAVGRSALSISPSGKVGVSDSLLLGNIDLQPKGDGSYSIIDNAGRACFYVSPSGQVHIPDLLGGLSGSYKYQRPPLMTVIKTDYWHIVYYGQSLSRGSVSNTAGVSTGAEISLTQPYANLTLNGGVNATPNMMEWDATAFKPLIEQSLLGTGSRNETPVSGTCNEFVRRVLADQPLYTANQWQLIGTSGGWGGQNIELLAGDTRFPYFIEQIKAAAALAKVNEKTYSVPAYVWMQGEAQYNDTPGAGDPFDTRTSDRFVYLQRTLDLYERTVEEIVKASDQAYLPYLFTYQTAGHRQYSWPTNPIALAQWDAAARDYVVMVAPVYAFDTNTKDYIHLTPEGSWLYGAYVGRAMFETLYRNRKWRPLEPVSVDWYADHIDMKFHVPYGGLVLDTAICSLAVNEGFDIWNGTALVDIITSVSVIGRDTVRIDLSEDAPAGAVLSYARGRDTENGYSGPVLGARGNLRDMHGDVDVATSPTGLQTPMHNACVMFEFNRLKGF